MKILSVAVGGMKMQTNLIGAPSFSQVNPYGLYNHFASDAYASSYPSVRAISNEFMGISPFAIDSNGKKVENNNIINALYHPNQLDSSVSFFEKIAVSTLVLAKTYILVWRNQDGEAQPGGDFGFKGSKIAGFTFLENPAITVRDGVTYYNIGSQFFTDKEVMTLSGGVDPHNLYKGYSPSLAAKKWATLDDYIADFQKGFFENGAVPAGQMIITSVSNTDYEDTKKTLQEKHRGVSNNNNIVYVPRPVGADGKPADAKIEWIPFAQSNKDIDFKNLFEQANQRIERSFGVSQFIQGVDDAPNYATAQVSEKNFAKRAVYPLALRTYTQITHELNRITGGIGIAITFKYEIPTVADEEKVTAETRNIEGTLIREMVKAGYSLDSIVDSFELSNSYKNLKKDTTTATVIENDKPDVDDGGEVDGAPDPAKIDGVTPLNKAKAISQDPCKCCNGTGEHDTGKECYGCDASGLQSDFTGDVPCNGVVNKVAANRTNPKAELTDEEKLEKAAKDLMQAQVDRAVADVSDEPVALDVPTDTELDDFIKAMMATITGILLAEGLSEYKAGVALAGINLEELQGFMLTETAESTYEMYLRRVGTSYGDDTANSIRKALQEADELGLNRSETKAKLKEIMDTDDWRVKRLARTELNNSQNIGKLEGIKSLSDETNTTWEKTISHSAGNICPLCASQEGRWTPIEQPLWAEGEAIEAIDAKGEQIIFVNDWQTNEANDYHPNGRGTLTFRRVIE